MEHLSGGARTDLTGRVHGVHGGEFARPFCRGPAQADTPVTGIFQPFTLAFDQIRMTARFILPNQLQNLFGQRFIRQQIANLTFSFLLHGDPSKSSM